MFTQTSPWHVVGTPHFRGSAHADYAPLGWPDLGNGDQSTWRAWLRLVWENKELAAAISYASPALASRAAVFLDGQSLRRNRARRLIAAVMRYVLRAQHRATPFGLFAGVTTIQVGKATSVHWHGYRPIIAPSGSWAADVVAQLEASPGLLSRTHVVTNSTASVQDGQLTVPQAARPDPGHPLARTHQVRLRHTSAVRVTLATALRPTPWRSVVEAVCAAHPTEDVETVTGMLTQLVWAGALLTSLRPPSTESPVVHLEAALRTMGSSHTPTAKKASRVREALTATNATGNAQTSDLAKVMGELSSSPPLGVDLRLDADITVPPTVTDAVQDAMGMLETLCPHRDGLASWRGWRHRFTDEYGTDLVPVTEVTQSSSVGYPNWDDTTATNFPVSERDQWLLERAQAATLDHRHEVLADDLLSLVQDQEHAQSVPHTEMRLRLESPSPAALDSGRFRLAVLGVSRTAGTLTGRFATMTGSANQLRTMLTSSSGPVPVQLSFPSQMARSAHVARVPQLLDHVISVAEYPPPGALGADDLAVGCDEQGLFLWSHSLGSRVQPVVPHALNLRFAPTLVRFLAELPRAELMPATAFSWGAAARLPFLPRLRSGRIVLSPACWRVRPEDLAPPNATWQEWERAWFAFAARRRVTDLVELGGGDQRLRLDLSEGDHRHLLRTHLTSTGTAVLREAPDPGSFGWCDGRPHEMLFQLARPEGET